MKIKNLPYFLVALVFSCCGFVSSPLLAQEFNAAKLDSFLTFLSNGKMMGSVAIVKKGVPIYQGHIGRERLDVMEKSGSENYRTNEASLYRIGSISKTYTAAMVMQLTDEGKLRLDDSLVQFYPNIKSAKGVTIKHLLNHHSGIPSFTEETKLMADVSRRFEKQEFLDFLNQKHSLFEPGSQAEYSNSNYLLLGWILEDISKKNYAANLRQRITAPLGLKHTFTLSNEPVNAAVAKSYRMQDKWVPAEITHASLPGGAGAVVASASDVGIFFYHLLSGKLITDKAQKALTSMENGFGLGIFAIPFYSQKCFGHNGRIDGFESMSVYNPADSTTFVILANALNYVMNDVGVGVLSIYYGKPYQIPEVREIKKIVYTPETLQPFTGDYYNADLKMNIAVKLQGSSLVAQATGQSAFPLTPMGENTFGFTAAGIEMKFGTMKDGKMQQFNLIQSNMLHIFIRVTAE